MDTNKQILVSLILQCTGVCVKCMFFSNKSLLIQQPTVIKYNFWLLGEINKKKFKLHFRYYSTQFLQGT